MYDRVGYVSGYGGKLWAVGGDSVNRALLTSGSDIILGDGWIINPTQAGAKVFVVERRAGLDNAGWTPTQPPSSPAPNHL